MIKYNFKPLFLNVFIYLTTVIKIFNVNDGMINRRELINGNRFISI